MKALVFSQMVLVESCNHLGPNIQMHMCQIGTILQILFNACSSQMTKVSAKIQYLSLEEVGHTSETG